MFCKQCGKRIEAGVPKCPHCGRVPDALSGGTGFWNLTQGPAKAVPVVQPQVVQQPVPSRVNVVSPEPGASVSAPPPVVEQPETSFPAPPPVEPDEAEGSEEIRKNRIRIPLIPVVSAGLVVLLVLVLVVQSVRLSHAREELNRIAIEAQQSEKPPETKNPEETAQPAEGSEEPTPALVPTAPTEETEPAEPTPELPEDPEEASSAQDEEIPVVREQVPLTAEFSDTVICVSVDEEFLKENQLTVRQYAWYVVYDPELDDPQRCYEIAERAEEKGKPGSQVDKYGMSPESEKQNLPVDEFYMNPSENNSRFEKRIFCRLLVREDGEDRIYYSEIIEPGPKAAEEWFEITPEHGDDGESLHVVEKDLPDHVHEMLEDGSVTCQYWVDFGAGTLEEGDPLEVSRDGVCEMTEPVTEEGTYYLVIHWDEGQNVMLLKAPYSLEQSVSVQPIQMQ